MQSKSTGQLFQVSDDQSAANLFKHRPDIDGLRGIAVLAVILYHMNHKWLPGGFIGVDIFFVISGYVVTASLIKNSSNNIVEYLLLFYSRRIKRILPALLVCILITTLLTTILVEPSQSELYQKPALYSLIGVSNIYFAYQKKGYYDFDQQLNPFLHTWSLGVEEQFYFFFPLLLFLGYAVGKSIKKDFKGVILFFIGILVAAVVVSMSLTITNPLGAYYLMPSRFWELATGAVLFLLFAHGYRLTSKTNDRVMQLIQILAVLLLGISLWKTPSTWGFPFPWALPAILSAVLFIAVGAYNATFISRLLSNPKIVFVGKASYSLYLWHWSIFTLFRWTIGLEEPIKYLVALATTVVLSLVSYYYIEQPIRYLKTSELKRIFKGGGFAVVTSGLIILLLHKSLPGNFYLGTKIAPEVWSDPTSVNLKGDFQCGPFWFNQNPYKKVADYGSCSLAAPNTRNINVLGDSHAQALIPMFKKLYEQKVISATVLTHSGCPVTPSLKMVTPDSAKGLFTLDSCFQYSRTEIERSIQSSKPGDILFLAYALGIYYVDDGNRVDDGKSDSFFFTKTSGERISLPDARLLLKKDLADIAHRMKEKDASLVVLAPLPVYPQSTKQCTSWLSKFNNDCYIKKNENLARREPVMEVITSLEKDLPNFYVWDAFSKLCSTEKCSQLYNGNILFSDNTHLSAYGSSSLTDEFIHFLNRNRLVGDKLIRWQNSNSNEGQG